MGGYFIINGIEKILRMLIMPRRNYVRLLMLIHDVFTFLWQNANDDQNDEFSSLKILLCFFCETKVMKIFVYLIIFVGYLDTN